MSEEPKPRWLLAGLTIALLVAGFIFLAIPSLRLVGGAILGGYFLLVEFALNKSIYDDHFARHGRRKETKGLSNDRPKLYLFRVNGLLR